MLVPDAAEAAVAGTKIALPREHWYTRRPSLEGLAPERVEPWAAVVAWGHRVVREHWSKETELGERLFARLQSASVRGAGTSAAQQFQELDRARPPVPQRCSNCTLRPGLAPCLSCVGTGFLSRSYEDGTDTMTPCGCDSGFATCTVCDGSTKTVLASVRYVIDTPSQERRLFVPEPAKLPPHTLSFALTSPGLLNDAHRMNPAPAARAYAYRDAAPEGVAPFHGFPFGGAAASALRWADAFGSGAHAVQLDFWAVPFFLLHFTLKNSVVRLVAWRTTQGSHEARLAE